MARGHQTKGVYYKEDRTGKIEYKITYFIEQQVFRVYKQIKNDEGKYAHRFTMKTRHIVDYKKDLSDLKQYIENELIGENSDVVNILPSKPQKESKDDKWVDLKPKKKKTSKARIQRENTEWEDYIPAKRTKRKSKYEVSDADIKPPCQLSDLNMTDLESLFVEWEKVQQNEPEWLWKITNGGNINIGKNHFRRDGIIDKETFKNETTKVLFLSSEANDNNYSAITQPKTNTVLDYQEYYRTGIDDYGGKMKELLAEMFKIICGIPRDSLANNESVIRFAVMDINKRGGGDSIEDGVHLKAYCKYYAPFIRKEIEIIDPDIVAIVGVKLYDLKLHGKYLGAIRRNGKSYFDLNGKMVPILSLYHTSSYRTRREPLIGYEDNRTIGKQAARCVEELQKFGINQKHA